MSSNIRSLLAVVLSMGVLLLWYTVIAPPPKPSPIPVVAQTVAPSLQVEASPPFAKGGDEIILENEVVRLGINTSGGRITRWELKNYFRNGKQESVSLAEANGSIFNTPFLEHPLLFQVVHKTPESIELKTVVPSAGITLHKMLKLLPNSYQAEADLHIQNDQKQTVAITPSLEWGKVSIEESPQRGILFFKSPPDRWHPISFQNNSFVETRLERIPDQQQLTGKIGWIGAQSRYFLAGIEPVGREGVRLELGKQQAGAGAPFFYQRILFDKAEILPGESWSASFKLFGGPKELKLLQQMGPSWGKTVGYGWTSLIAVPILHLLQLFYRLVHNYGIAIILLTVLIKLLLNPINRKSLQSMKGMQAIQPRLKELQQKYKDDKEKLNQEMMMLFKSHKINPMGGCLPMLLQIPIYISLYKVLWGSVELYQAPFFWFYRDLSAPDPYFIVPLLLGITMFVQTKMTPTATADPAQQKMMMLMPLMFCGFMIFLPMGLGLYILVNTLMTILQQWMYKKELRFRDLLFSAVRR